MYSPLCFYYFSIILLYDYTTIRPFVYSLFRVLVISSGFYFAFLKLIKNCIEIYSVLFPTILLFDYTTKRLFVVSFIRLFDETSSLMVYSCIRVFVYSCIRVFVYSCIRRDFVSNGVFVISCTCHIEWFLFCFFIAK